MSTILKALRRLEEDNPPASTESGRDGASTAAHRSVDPSSSESPVADDLRERILAEEAAARVSPIADEVAGSRNRKRLVFAAAGFVLLLSVGGGIAIFAGGQDRDLEDTRFAATPPVSLPVAAPAPAKRSETGPGSPTPTSDRASGSGPLAAAAPARSSVPTPKPSASAPAAAPRPAPTPVAKAARPASPPVRPAAPSASAAPTVTAQSQPKPAPRSEAKAEPPKPRATAQATAQTTAKTTAQTTPPADKPMAVAAVTPTQATLDANRAKPLASSPAKPGTQRPGSKPSERAPAKVAAATRPAELVSAAKPTPDRLAADSRKVETVARRGIPDVTVLRTSWHPRADRRSAKIRLESTDETMTLREGDAVGGLVISEISPSGVLFKTGDVEIRRRVGEAGS